MTVERACEGGRCWQVALEGTTLYLDGVGIPLEAHAGREWVRLPVYADGAGRPTLEATDWLGAEVFLPPRGVVYVQVGEEIYEGEEGPVRVPRYEVREEPLQVALIRVRLFPVFVEEEVSEE